MKVTREISTIKIESRTRWWDKYFNFQNDRDLFRYNIPKRARDNECFKGKFPNGSGYIRNRDYWFMIDYIKITALNTCNRRKSLSEWVRGNNI